MKRNLFQAYLLPLVFLLISHCSFGQNSDSPSRLNLEPIEQITKGASLGQFSLDDLKLFSRLFEQIKYNYVEEISDAELLELAIKGMLSQLDPHSEFLDQEKREQIENSADGSFVGLGLELTMEEGDLIVVSPLDDSPAKRANIQPGDVILKIDNQRVRGLSLNQALDLMDENPDAPLTFLISRQDEVVPVEVSLVREKIVIGSVNVKTLTHDIGYIRIRQFQKNTGIELQEKLNELLENSPYITGLILDLRNNPGGVLQAAVEVTDTFLDEGVVVTTRGRAEGTDSAFYASPKTISPSLPLVVLINQGSASASEIVAGALQDHNRAVIMGDISFGKGSVQNVVSIDDTRAIKLTTARYYTPSGRSIQAQGIFPDISVLDGDIERKSSGFQINEAALTRHLENDGSGDEPELLGMRETLSDIDDLQLSQALAFLKGLAVYQR